MSDAERLSPANAFDLPDFVLTPPVVRVREFCAAVYRSQTVGLLVGTAGVGKTWAAQYAAQQQPAPEERWASPVLYTSVDVDTSPRILLRNILYCLGPDYRAPVAEAIQMVCCWMHRRLTQLIVLDNCERLDRVCWDVIRDLHDRTRCAFVCIAPPEVPLRLRRLEEEIHNRVSLTVEMPPLTFDEVFDFLRKRQEGRVHPRDGAEFYVMREEREDVAMVKELYRVTLGNLRRVLQFVQEAERIAHVNQQSYVGLPVVTATAQLLAQSWYGGADHSGARA